MTYLPNLTSPSAPDLRREKRRAIVSYLVGVLLLLGIFGALVVEQYQRDTETAEERLEARADLVEEWVISTFATSEVLLGSVAARLEGGERLHDLREWLVELRDTLAFLGKRPFRRVISPSRLTLYADSVIHRWRISPHADAALHTLSCRAMAGLD